MERKNNYLIQRDRAVEYFLSFNQEELIAKWRLSGDDKYIFTELFGEGFAIERKTGRLHHMAEGRVTDREAGFGEVLTLYDLLCHSGEITPFASGKFAQVNSLKNSKAIGVSSKMFEQSKANFFDEHYDAFKNACLALGAKEIELGDVGFEFPVFWDLKVRLKFYRADDEFPAQLTILWDENALDYMFYETVFYAADLLLGKIKGEMV